MIKNKLKLSIAVSLMIATCGFAGTVTAPNVDNIELSGDMEFKYIKEKTDTKTINKREAEINLNLDATVTDILKVYTQFQVYDDNQADANADKTIDVTHAYAQLPIMQGKGQVLVGLVPNFVYGTDAFDDGEEDWKIMVQVPVSKGIKIAFISKIKNEEDQDKDRGDTKANAIRIDAKVGEFMIGAKYAQGHANKGDGFAPSVPADKEKKSKNFAAYTTGSVAGFDLGFEYLTKDITFQNTPAVFTQPEKQKGYYASVGKEIGSFSGEIAYINLKNGIKGGDDFEPALIFKEDSITSSATKDTTAFIVPLSYSINENLTADITYIDADIQGVDAKEFDIGLGYKFNKNVTLSTTYGDFDGKTGCAIEDTKNFELALAITF